MTSSPRSPPAARRPRRRRCPLVAGRDSASHRPVARVAPRAAAGCCSGGRQLSYSLSVGLKLIMRAVHGSKAGAFKNMAAEFPSGLWGCHRDTQVLKQTNI